MWLRYASFITEWVYSKNKYWLGRVLYWSGKCQLPIRNSLSSILYREQPVNACLPNPFQNRQVCLGERCVRVTLLGTVNGRISKPRQHHVFVANYIKTEERLVLTSLRTHGRADEFSTSLRSICEYIRAWEETLVPGASDRLLSINIKGILGREAAQ